MNVAKSFEDFENAVKNKWMHKLNFVPVLLIPSTVLFEFNDKDLLNRLFNFFDIQTKELQFFVPGYSLEKCDGIALELDRLKTVYYSDRDFSDIIREITEKSQKHFFHGGADLLLIPVKRNNNSRIRLVYRNLISYDLTSLYNLHNNTTSIRAFLANVIGSYVLYTDENEFLSTVNKAYNDQFPHS